MDIKYIRENTEESKKVLRDRFMNDHVIESILNYDKIWIKVTYDFDQIKKRINKIGGFVKDAVDGCDYSIDEVQEIMANITNGSCDVDIVKTQPKSAIIYILNCMKKTNQENTELKKEYKGKRDILLNTLPNFLHPEVPIEKSEDNNVIVRTHEGTKPTSAKLQLHSKLCEKYKITDCVAGVGVAGNRGYFFRHWGVKLNRALVAYAMDFAEKRGYEFMQVPHFMKKEAISKVSQLSEFQETLYKVDDQDTFLIATSEQPITAYFRDKCIKDSDLPIKHIGVSSCYRKEAGSHGKDTLGIFRVHQFEKVEQFCLTDSEKSWDMFDNMINVAEEFYKSLGISYRVVEIVSGGLNNAAARKYDLEAYFPASGNYKELVSCSNCLDYFSKRINCKTTKGKYPHMLNSTLMANTRTICCLLETYQSNDSIKIPDVLVPYMGTEIIN